MCGVKVSVCVSVMWNVCDVELSINLTTISQVQAMSPNLFLINSILPGKDAQMLQRFDSFLSLILLTMRDRGVQLLNIFLSNFMARAKIFQLFTFLSNYKRGKCVSVTGHVISIDLLSYRIKWQVFWLTFQMCHVCTPNIRLVVLHSSRYPGMLAWNIKYLEYQS